MPVFGSILFERDAGISINTRLKAVGYNISMPWHDYLSVNGQVDRKTTGFGQPLHEAFGKPLGNVLNDDDGQRKILGQSRQQLLQDEWSACGGADSDEPDMPVRGSGGGPDKIASALISVVRS